MSGTKHSRRKSKVAPRISRKKIPELDSGLNTREKYFDIFVILLLLGFGIYHSVLYWAHQPVPHADFSCFANLGHQILALEIPSGFKRAPVVGILQVLLGKIAGGRNPDLAGAWLLNSLLHLLTAVLLWLVGRRIVGRAAAWLAIVAVINPWVLQLLTEAIAETTLLCCVLATFYLMFRRSNWCYLLASITTMVRYEGAALIFAAFVMDMICRKTTRERIWAFVYSAIASIPLALWMLGTYIFWEGGSFHYLAEMGDYSGGKIILPEYIRLLWQDAFYPLFMPSPTATKGTVDMLFGLSKVLAAVSFIFGVTYGLYKRRWNILALLIFFVPYIFIHAVHGVKHHRYLMPVVWLPLLICFYGLKSAWGLINKNKRIPQFVVIVSQGILMILAVMWLIQLFPYLEKLAPISRSSVSIPYVAMAVAVIIFAARRFVYKLKYSWRDLSILAVLSLVIVSNQFALAGVMGNGQRDIEFKYLLDWYHDNAKPGEKLALSVAVFLSRMSSAELRPCFVATKDIEADNPADFVKACYEQGITYVVWDSRLGLIPKSRYYKMAKMYNFAQLAKPADIGPYKFITQLRANKRRYVNVFRLRRPTKPLQNPQEQESPVRPAIN